MQIQDLRPKISNRKKKRVGRGSGSGHGKTSTRGHKGAGQRKGSPHYIGLEGGNVPYLRKIPKRGFSSKHAVSFQIVNLDDIMKRLKDKKEITPRELKEANLIDNVSKPVKVLARLQGKLSFKATFKAHKFSKKAEELITNSGGKAEWLGR
ncbi:MAG: 50S ribosomal protein L15 [Candidatus Omnitrophica bacterium 4484_171]|nr:MAG: 50S ribosomal protein L15 [Candidatus Omnitrophica bacterium 4484_171]